MEGLIPVLRHPGGGASNALEGAAVVGEGATIGGPGSAKNEDGAVGLPDRKNMDFDR